MSRAGTPAAAMLRRNLRSREGYSIRLGIPEQAGAQGYTASMVTSAMATTGISLEEYLRTVPDPDVEYIDGFLKERPVVFSIHGLLQLEIGMWFNNHRKEWNVRAAVEVRTQVAKDRVRIPDVVVDAARKWPAILTSPPMIVIEILSPSDSMIELEQKCDEYSAMGIANVWVINPEKRSGRTCRQGNWTETRRFTVEGTEIYLDLEQLFAEMDSYEDEPVS